MSLASRISVTLDATLTSALDLVTGTAPHLVRKIVDLTNGIAANQADRIFSDRRTIAASTTEDLDLAGGTLLDALGAALTFVKVKAILIVASAANTNDVVVGGDANAVPIFGAVAHTQAVKPGGVLLIVAPNLAGFPVTPGTGDILQVANGGAGTGVTYDVVIIGTSA